MIKSKFTFLNILIIICALSIITVLIFYLTQDKEDNITVKQVNTEEETLREANREAIKKAQIQQVKPVRAIDDTDHIWGDINAPVQLIIYDDFECPFCAKFYDTTEQIKQEFGDKVVVAFRHFPLTIHPQAMTAALAAECAAEQGKFWQMYHKLFADNKAGQMNKEQFKQDAVNIGLDAVKFNQCLDIKKYKDKVLAQMLEGKNAGVSGTPGNFVNGEPLPGAYPFEDFIRRDGKKAEGMKSIILRHLEYRN